MTQQLKQKRCPQRISVEGLRTIQPAPHLREVGTTQDNEFRAAVEQHRDTVFRLAYTYVRDAADADDVAQDVFVKLLRHNEPFVSGEHLRNWLVRVTINQCRSLFRRPWRRVEDLESYAETLAMPTEEHADLFVHVMRLPEKYRVPLVLYYWGNYSTDEVATLLHMRPATIRTRLARARAQLRTLLNEEDRSWEPRPAATCPATRPNR